MSKLKIKKLIQGFNAVADAVGKTMGSEGGYAISHNDFDNPDITKDGISVARKIFFEDKAKNIGATEIPSLVISGLSKSLCDIDRKSVV